MPQLSRYTLLVRRFEAGAKGAFGELGALVNHHLRDPPSRCGTEDPTVAPPWHAVQDAVA